MSKQIGTIDPRRSASLLRSWSNALGGGCWPKRQDLRKARGLTQEALAHAAEIETRYVGGIERGEENPTVAVLARVVNDCVSLQFANGGYCPALSVSMSC
jgi:DNA-binding XRE family transcriptional regulator